MKRYRAILGTLYDTVHCILPAKLDEIAAFLEAKAGGLAIEEPVEVEEPVVYGLAVGSGEQVALDKMTAAGSGDAFLAVMPLFGTMMQHGGLEMSMSGGTSTEQFGRQFDALDANPAVKTIVIEGHSPGGQVWGTQELSDKIFAARERGATRIVGAVNSQIASAALWTITAANQVFVTPGGEMGSVGVVTMHVDVSEAEQKRGIRRTLIATPDKKIEGHPFAALDPETAAEWLAGCEKTLTRFVGALARNRKVSDEHVRSGFGGGGMLRADEAVRAKMADGVATFGDVLAAEMEKLRSVGRGNAKANARALDLAEAG